MKLKNKKIAFSLLVTSSALVIPLIAASCNSTQVSKLEPIFSVFLKVIYI
ncbi:variable surface lipoprotein [Mycoplasmopsis ciconiae]|uniref:Variable surface lipoprotein n=1 Tax=Mycoplasmopsis ciconiae TaxID=561067 RepID=A0ABU7MKN6_9BACT|nr:variable surface lipoprotein [Mycoplasmopsis ciconiae]